MDKEQIERDVDFNADWAIALMTDGARHKFHNIERRGNEIIIVHIDEIDLGGEA
jgi:hypothetical protein